jgi:hypothetical protein
VSKRSPLALETELGLSRSCALLEFWVLDRDVRHDAISTKGKKVDPFVTCALCGLLRVCRVILRGMQQTYDKTHTLDGSTPPA